MSRVRRKLTAQEFRQDLADLNMSVKSLARELGKVESRVMGWYRGEDDVPSDVALLLAVMKVPGARDALQARARDLAIDERRPAATAKRSGSE